MKVTVQILLQKIDLTNGEISFLLDNDELPRLTFDKGGLSSEVGRLFSLYFDLDFDWVQLRVLDAEDMGLDEIAIIYTGVIPYQFTPLQGDWRNLHEIPEHLAQRTKDASQANALAGL